MKRFAISEKPSLILAGVETAEVGSDAEVVVVVPVWAVLVEGEAAIVAGALGVERVRWRNILATWRVVVDRVDERSSRDVRASAPELAFLLTGACIYQCGVSLSRELE